MEAWIREILTHVAAFLAGATITIIVNRIRINNNSSYRVKQNNNTVKGDLIGRDKKLGK